MYLKHVRPYKSQSERAQGSQTSFVQYLEIIPRSTFLVSRGLE